MLSPQDLQQLLQAFAQSQLAQTQQQGQTAQALQGQRLQQREQDRTPVHLGMSGNMIDPTTGREQGNPFDTGFFQSAAQRQTTEQNRLGTPGYSSMSPEGTQAAVQQTKFNAPNLFSQPPTQSFDPVSALDATLTAPAPPKALQGTPQYSNSVLNRGSQAMNQINQMRNPPPQGF